MTASFASASLTGAHDHDAGALLPDPGTENSEWPPGRSIPHRGPWTQLIQAVVEVRRHGRHCRYARIDAASSDSQIAWIAADGNHPRRLIDKISGYELWINPAQAQRLVSLTLNAGSSHPVSRGIR
jgi:hypothetical protein